MNIFKLRAVVEVRTGLNLLRVVLFSDAWQGWRSFPQRFMKRRGCRNRVPSYDAASCTKLSTEQGPDRGYRHQHKFLRYDDPGCRHKVHAAACIAAMNLIQLHSFCFRNSFRMHGIPGQDDDATLLPARNLRRNACRWRSSAFVLCSLCVLMHVSSVHDLLCSEMLDSSMQIPGERVSEQWRVGF